MSESHLKDALLDRLVDGELSAQEREQTLLALEESPDGWRRCALAFLEAQSWRQQMTQLVSPFALRQEVSLPQAAQARGPRSTWLALAASVLFAFLAGWLMRGPQSTGNLADQLTETTVEGVMPEDVANDLGTRDSVTLLVRDTAGRAQRIRVPLIGSTEPSNEFGESLTAIPENYRKNLRERGYDVHGRRRYAPLYFEQDKQLVPMVVPVDDAYVVPVNRHIY